MAKILKLILYGLLIAGLVWFVIYRNAIARLQQEKQSLQQIVGVFGPAYFDNLLVTQRANESPFHFEWYLKYYAPFRPKFFFTAGQFDVLTPADFSNHLQEVGFYSHRIGEYHRPLRQSIFIELREQQIWCHAVGPVTRLWKVESAPALTQILNERWNELIFESIGTEQAKPYGVATSRVPFLKVSIPPTILDEMDEVTKAQCQQQFPGGVVLEFGVVWPPGK